MTTSCAVVRKPHEAECDHGWSAQYDARTLSQIPHELDGVRAGRGVPVPDLLEGMTVALLGGDMRFERAALGSLVKHGRVIPVGTDELLRLPIDDASVDVLITSCVLSKAPDVHALLGEMRRVMKPGAELMLTEVVADKRVPRRVQLNRKYSPCLAQAFYAGDLRRELQRAGWFDVRTLFSRPLEKIERVRFSAVTMRGFNLPLEDACEDYGQFAVYQGTIAGSEEAFDLDGGHRFAKDEMVYVCKNTADMLAKSRYARHFEVSPEHFHKGPFDCSSGAPKKEETADDDGSASKCGSGGCC